MNSFRGKNKIFINKLDIVMKFKNMNNLMVTFKRSIKINNIRSFSLVVFNNLSTNDLNTLKIKTNLVELSLYSGLNSQQKFDFICDNFTQLKSFCFHGLQFTSISNLIKLINLEYFELIIDRIDIDFSSMDKNNCFNN
jgi:hypothetical protein